MKKLFIIFTILLIAFSISSCRDVKESPDANKDNEKENEVIESLPENEEREVTLYFVNSLYVNTGDESKEKLIVEKRNLKIDDEITIEEAVVRELMKGTDNKDLETEIPKTANLIDVKVSNETAYVNFAREGMHGGSLQESFTISQIVKSLLELDEINKVQFLIDGKVEESLMGHFDISKPFEE